MVYATSVPVSRLEFSEGFNYYGSGTTLVVSATVNLPVSVVRHVSTGETLSDGGLIPSQDAGAFDVPDTGANGWVTDGGGYIRGWSYDLVVTISAAGEPNMVWTGTIHPNRTVEVITPGMGVVSALEGSAGEPGPPGIPGVNAVENDTAVAGYINTAGTATRTAVQSRVDAGRHINTVMSGTQDFNTLPDGIATLGAFPTDWVGQHAPRENWRGIVETVSMHANAKVQTAVEWWGARYQAYNRIYNSGTWTVWAKLQDADDAAQVLASAKAYTDQEKYVYPTNLAAGTDWDNLQEDGLYKLSAPPTDWAAQHLPASGFRGELRVTNMHVNALIQTATEWRVGQFNLYSRIYYSGTWSAWSHVGGEPLPASGLKITDRVKLAEVHKPNGHELERDTMAAYYGGVVETNGAAPLALVWDDYPTSFRDLMLPLLDARGLVATLAVCSQTLSAERAPTLDPLPTGATRTTWAEMNGWTDRIEFANHSQTHLGISTLDGLHREIVTGRDELRANIPSRPVFTWVQPSATYDYPFNNGNTLASYTDTTAGRLQMDYHGFVTGTRFVIPGDYTVPARGKAPDGMTRSWVDNTTNLTATQARIDQIAGNGRGLIVSGHAVNMTGADGKPSVAQIEGLLDQIVAHRDAGRIRPVFLSEFAIADSRA